METRKNTNLVIITQAIDEQHYVLSPFLKWFDLIAQDMTTCSIICLYKGSYTFDSPNIHVYSLGKETGEKSSWQYALRLYRYIWQLYRNGMMDAIFVHMNEIYILLLAPLNVFARIPIFWWKAHGHLSKKTRFAVLFVRRIFTSSESGFSISTPKRYIVGQGIDTKVFTLRKTYADTVQHILYVGRISKIKYIHILIDALVLLKEHCGIALHCTIVGPAETKSERNYVHELRERIKTYNLESYIHICPPIAHQSIVHAFHETDLVVNPSYTNSLDKVVLEAMACGTPVLTSNIAFAQMLKDVPGSQFTHGDAQNLMEQLVDMCATSADERKKMGSILRQKVETSHTIVSATKQISEQILLSIE